MSLVEHKATTPFESGSMFNKVAEVTVVFWIAKIMATTVGETGADFLIFNLKFGLANTSVLMGALLLVVIAIQIGVRRYIPWRFWHSIAFLLVIVGLLAFSSLGRKPPAATFR